MFYANKHKFSARAMLCLGHRLIAMPTGTMCHEDTGTLERGTGNDPIYTAYEKMGDAAQMN